MVSVHPSPVQGFHFFDPVNMGLPGLNSTPPSSTATSGTASAALEDPSKKVRKPYTITKSRESWTDQEHDKFLEALQLFDRDWKKIEAFVGSKTVIQIRSHAQKYFLKVQKSGTSEHVPPPRPKRKAVHPYPQKAPKVPATSHMNKPFQPTSTLYEPDFAARPDASPKLGNTVANLNFSAWSYNSIPAVNVSEENKDEVCKHNSMVASSNCYSSSMVSTPKKLLKSHVIDRESHQSARVIMPDFAQVYKFIGSVFDPNESGHLQRMRQLDPINLETVLLLMRNLCVNLTSPEFEEQKRMLASYNGNIVSGPFSGENSGSPILSS